MRVALPRTRRSSDRAIASALVQCAKPVDAVIGAGTMLLGVIPLGGGHCSGRTIGPSHSPEGEATTQARSDVAVSMTGSAPRTPLPHQLLMAKAVDRGGTEATVANLLFVCPREITSLGKCDELLGAAKDRG